MSIRTRLVAARRNTRIARALAKRRRLRAQRGKAEIVNHLARMQGFRRYLEFCTGTTGHEFARIDRALFEDVTRAMYACPPSFDDGLPIDLRCEGGDAAPLLDALRRRPAPPDICLVDSRHDYDTSMRDLREVYALLPDGGAMVVHDCLPRDAALASPVDPGGAWCGVSYKAFLDFVLTMPGQDWLTVDCDHGCGVIVKGRRLTLRRGLRGTPEERSVRRGARPRDGLTREWLSLGDDYDRAYAMLSARGPELLRLVRRDVFFDRARVA